MGDRLFNFGLVLLVLLLVFSAESMMFFGDKIPVFSTFDLSFTKNRLILLGAGGTGNKWRQGGGAGQVPTVEFVEMRTVNEFAFLHFFPFIFVMVFVVINITDTVSITGGHVFGGYTDQAWESRCGKAEASTAMRPPWPSLAAQQLVDKRPCQLAKRFPGLIGGLVEEIKGDLKTKTDSLILDAVSHRVRLFSDEIASVEGRRKEFTTNAVEISVIEAGRVSALTKDIVLIFLRYKGCMLQELQSSVRDRLVGRVSLPETCAEQRLEMISKEEALHRAKEGIFELLGLTTPEERQEWKKRSKMTQSVILSWLQADTILGWLGVHWCTLGKQTKLELLYRASRDGWRATDFHSKCNNKGATVTVIKTTGGYVFGGYADEAWESRGGHSRPGKTPVSSSNAFLFALQYPSGVVPAKMPLLQPQYAMHDHPSFGPSFGSGLDIYVADNANSNSTSHTNVGTYQLSAGQIAHTFLTGALKF